MKKSWLKLKFSLILIIVLSILLSVSSFAKPNNTLNNDTLVTPAPNLLIKNEDDDNNSLEMPADDMIEEVNIDHKKKRSKKIIADEFIILDSRKSKQFEIDLDAIEFYSGVMNVKKSGDVGIGTSNIGADLEVYDDFSNADIKINAVSGNSANLILDADTSRDAWITYSQAGDVKWYLLCEADDSDKFYIKANTNTCVAIDQSTCDVGVGTISPSEKLEVIGNIKASGIICDSNGCIGTGGDSLWNKNGDDIYYNDGNVGIGTTSPASILHVAKDMTVYGAHVSGVILAPEVEVVHRKLVSFNSTGVEIIPTLSTDWTPKDTGISLYVSGSRKGYLNIERGYGVYVEPFTDLPGAGNTNHFYPAVFLGGNVGIGTSIPDEKLDVDGNIKISGTQYIGDSQIYWDDANSKLVIKVT